MKSLNIRKITSTECLKDFVCGVPPMDRFIHDGLQLSMDHNYCRTYIVTENDDVIALFALSFDSVDLDEDDKEELACGIASTGIPDVAVDYEDTFYSKRRYPALDIAYLAVAENLRGRHLGTAIVDQIVQMAETQDLAGCQFVSVEALKTEPWSAVMFYDKCGFTPNELPNPNKDTLRMIRTLRPKNA